MYIVIKYGGNENAKIQYRYFGSFKEKGLFVL